MFKGYLKTLAQANLTCFQVAFRIAAPYNHPIPIHRKTLMKKTALLLPALLAGLSLAPALAEPLTGPGEGVFHGAGSP